MKKLLYISLALILSACGSNSSDKATELAKLKKERAALDQQIAKLETEIGAKNAVANTKNVNGVELKEEVFQNYLEIQGKIDADQNVQVSPEAQGIVTAVLVKAGQNVQKGQTIAQIDDQILRESISELQTQLELANTVFQRQKNLWDQKIGTEIQYLNAKTQRDALTRRMAALKSQAALYRIKAPISGTVDQLDIKVGQAVMPGMPGIRVVNSSNLKVKALVAESYSGKVNQGDEVLVILPDLQDTLKSRLSFASKTIDASSRSFGVEVKLPTNKTYRQNMVAVLKIVDYENKNAITVPVNAIQKSERGDYVYISVQNKAKRTLVKPGKTSGGKTEILSGLKAGDKLITTGLAELNDGVLVKF